MVCSTFSSDADAAHDHCLTVYGIGGTRINNDSGCKFNPGMAPRYGTVASHTEREQNHSWDQWNHWNASDWNQLSSWSARGNDDGWSSRSQWHSEPKKYFDKSPPPEWDGNHPEKTWRDCRRTLKEWLSTTDVPPEKHGMLLWRALTGDAKLLISHFRD